MQSIAQFQAPLRLNPQLLDDGREVISGVFNLSYRGSGQPKLDVATGSVIDSAFQINSVEFEKACTQGMIKDEAFKLACQILPSGPRKLPNADRTAWYLTYNLHSAEKLSETKESYWNEFKKRKIVFPLKVQINYQERDTAGKLGPAKTQSACVDIGYFVDIPIDSKDMLPDVVAEQGLKGIEFTIEKIDQVLPYLEKAILVSGVGCISSFLGRMATRWTRLFISKTEFYFSKTMPEDQRCPSDQQNYLLESTKKQWLELEAKGVFSAPENQPRIKDWQTKKTLDELCPKTASLWKFESGLDQAYRWTCDRVFCRAVPAGWTSTKDKTEVDTVIASQNQCTASSRGIPLSERENCGELIEENTNVANPSAKAARLITKGEFTCYQHGTILYYPNSNSATRLPDGGYLTRLERVHDFGLSLPQSEIYAEAGDLIAYRPAGSDQYIVGQDKTCEQTCRSKPQYRAYVEKGLKTTNKDGVEGSFGCFQEQVDETTGEVIPIGVGGQKMQGSKQLSAGYTNECFIEYKKGTVTTADANIDAKCDVHDDCTGGALCLSGVCSKPSSSSVAPIGADQQARTTGLLQCVCIFDEKEKQIFYGARTAAKEANGVAEEWDYRQDRIFKENKERFGTYYPEWRYYSGRDFSSAFGANYVLDYINDPKEVHQVNPHTQTIGTFQTMCLSGVRARLITLRSILEGLRGCIQEAKYTGLHDAGVCKTIFAQHVCGLMYKAIAYFVNSCTPHPFGDEGKGGAFDDVGAVFEAGLSSIPEAMESSITDIKDDYGNAQLNDYFATGAQGFAQSMCLAAFGYDWPLGMDFILDAAYAFPTKTTVHILPAERELATFNPAKGTAVYNYNIGALILPGCRIRSYDVYLKCVGPEDQGHPGIECGPQGCDCLRATTASGTEGEKIKYLDGGRGFDLKTGSLVSVPIPAPQKIDSDYRYDHVVVDLRLDPLESAEQCFDEGYKDGTFYFPIIDTSPPGELVCQVQPLTGRYTCPELLSAFGGAAGAYLEDPFVSCYDDDTQSWISCSTPNLYTKGDQVKVRSHIVTDGGKYCVQTKVSGLAAPVPELAVPLPENIPGPFTPTLNLGTVRPELFTGAITTLLLTPGSAQEGCSQPELVSGTEAQVPAQSLNFNYQLSGGNYIVTIPPGVEVNAPYSIRTADRHLLKSGSEVLAAVDIQQAVFNIKGLQVKNLIGAPSGRSNACIYQVSPAASQGAAQNAKTITFSVELLQPDRNGYCFSATIPVKAPAFGQAKHTEYIPLQLEPPLVQVENKMHEEFLRGNHAYVQSYANTVLNRKQGDLEDAVAIYYAVADYIVVGGKDWDKNYKNQVLVLLKIFFTREYQISGEFGEPSPAGLKQTSEYEKVRAYLCEVDASLKGAYYRDKTYCP